MAKYGEEDSADPTALNTSCSEAISVLKRRLFDREAIILCINIPYWVCPLAVAANSKLPKFTQNASAELFHESPLPKYCTFTHVKVKHGIDSFELMKRGANAWWRRRLDVTKVTLHSDAVI